ncbi:MFS permease (drug) [Robiginitalea biformata HTCC2501]|uniref:MFS permease (Drug) n=1 Tax=Robiginitalea biformata (strain ATCC BAA-864 / DSM 15991 / KCTC 12146 / HTCC2501) TaxID=313596 RepID=A4CM37_ROBBH|nr:MFS permease (drug) [Robiginitalea biformata HTCC2501]
MYENRWEVKLSLLLVSSLTIASMITISASLPDMSRDFSGYPNGQALVKLSLSLPALFIALTSLLAGGYIDRKGRKPLLGVALVAYALAGSSGYWLEDLYAILAGRALLGVCVGITMTIVTTLIADYYQGAARQRFAGTQIALMSLAGILFISLGGFLADIRWDVPFLLYLFSLLILPIALRFIREPEMLAEIIQKTPGGRAPREIWLVFGTVMLMWILFFIVPVQIPFYLKSLGVEQNALIGLAIASSTLFSAVASFFYARIKGRLSFARIFFAGFGLMAVAFLVVAFSGTYALVVVGMLLAGLGMGLLIPNANILVMQLAPPAVRGKQIGRLTTFWFLGQFISPLVLLPFIGLYSLETVFLGIGILTAALALLFLMSSPLWKKAG